MNLLERKVFEPSAPPAEVENRKFVESRTPRKTCNIGAGKRVNSTREYFFPSLRGEARRRRLFSGVRGS
jgi:hypothetical protein